MVLLASMTCLLSCSSSVVIIGVIVVVPSRITAGYCTECHSIRNRQMRNGVVLNIKQLIVVVVVVTAIVIIIIIMIGFASVIGDLASAIVSEAMIIIVICGVRNSTLRMSCIRVRRNCQSGCLACYCCCLRACLSLWRLKCLETISESASVTSFCQSMACRNH